MKGWSEACDEDAAISRSACVSIVYRITVSHSDGVLAGIQNVLLYALMPQFVPGWLSMFGRAFL